MKVRKYQVTSANCGFLILDTCYLILPILCVSAVYLFYFVNTNLRVWILFSEASR
jgi:hypothetical protein